MSKLSWKSTDRAALIWLGIISALTHLPWVLLLRNFTSGDWWYISIEKYRDFAQFSPIWVTDGLGSTSAVPHFYFIRFLEGILTHLGSSFALNEKLFFLLPMAFGATFGMYVLARQYFNPWPAFIGAMVFAFNTPMLFNHVGPLTIGTAYALAPWCIYFFKRFLDEVTTKWMICSALAFGIVALYELRIALIIIAVGGGLFVFNTIIGEGWPYARMRLARLAGLFGIVLLLHAFWVFPYAISSRAVTFSDLLSRGLFVSFSDIQNALTLQHPFWTGARPATFVVQSIPLYAWIIPIAAFGGFVLRGTKAAREIYFWGIVAGAGLFLVKQVNEPFMSVYPWLFGHVPGFGAYRESSKFYLLIALAYAILIPFTLTTLKEVLQDISVRKRLRAGWLPVTASVLSVAVLGLFLVNTIPLLSGSFRTMYVPHTMPNDYKTLEKFIASQPEQFRTLWVPVTSRWGIASNDHPALLATSTNQGAWLSSIGAGDQTTYATLRDKAVRLFQSPSSGDALNRAGVKYVIVPLRDTANEDDFFRYYGDDRQYYIDQLQQVPYLQRIDAGTKEVAVFENKTYQPYFSTFTNLQSFGIDKNTDITTLYSFITKQADMPFNFVDSTKTAKHATFPQTDIINVFQDVTKDDITKATLAKTLAAQTNPVLYMSANNQAMRYTISGNQLTFYAQSHHALQVNGQALDTAASEEKVVGTATLQPNTTYYLSADDKPLELKNEQGSRQLGIIDQPLSVYATAGRNVISNPSFETGTWQPKVSDCNKYDRQPFIKMSLKGGDATNGTRSLQLEADRHTACTVSNNIDAGTNYYLLSFDYRVSGARNTGYELLFDGQKPTKIKEDISVNDIKWHHFQKIITTPAGTNSLQLRLLGYPDYRLLQHATTNFDNTKLLPLSRSVHIASENGQPFTKVALPKNTPLTFSYPNNTVAASNRIGNGTFEQGTWQQKVADCNDYDDNPQIGMQLVSHAGGQALELSAKRHDACTSTSRTSVHENTNYMFSFAYQSPNANAAGYFVRFNDPAQTTIEETLPIKDSAWQTYERQIKAPLGATRMNIVVYARAAESGGTTILNRYDTFTLREIPDLPNRYFVVNAPTETNGQPSKIDFRYVNAVKKSLTVHGASKPFYLRMSEAYHPLWKIRFGQPSVRDAITQTPVSGGTMLPESTHFRLNDFENGWYINPGKTCAMPGASCTKHADGSYDMQLVVEFTPQRWFFSGAVVSLVTLTGCILTLTYAARHRDGKFWHWR